jgi:hypothetical protein
LHPALFPTALPVSHCSIVSLPRELCNPPVFGRAQQKTDCFKARWL